METYASLSLDSVNLFSPANKNVFPRLCNPHGFTDADAYCAKGTGDVCCGLCPNNSVRGIFQLVWAIVSYGVASFTYTLAPTEVWGLAIMQVVNANAFIATGLIRVLMGATSGGMARYDTMFLWPQALGFIFIMVPAILAPNWSRVGLSQKDMEERMRKEAKTSPTNARRSDVRAVEAALYKKHHDRWSLPILAFWIINMSAWTGLYAWVSLADIEFSQANCEGEAVLDMTLTPTVVTVILGTLAWLLVIFDGFLVLRKEKQGGSDFIIDMFLSKGKNRTMKEHRRLERRITIGVTLALFVLWLFLNCWLWIEGSVKFYISGADWVTFGQVEQITALFPDLLALAAGVSGYLSTRDDLRLSRREVETFVAQRASQAGGDDDAHSTRRRSRLHGLHRRLRSGRASAEKHGQGDTGHSHTSSGDEDLPSRHDSPLRDDGGQTSATSSRRASLTALPRMANTSTRVRRRALSRDFHPGTSDDDHPQSTQHSRATSRATSRASTDSEDEHDAAHAPYSALPRPERGSLVTLRNHLGMPPPSHHDREEALATGHDEHERAAQKSLAKRHRSRGRRAARGRGLLEEEAPLREESEEQRGW